MENMIERNMKGGDKWRNHKTERVFIGGGHAPYNQGSLELDINQKAYA